MRGQQRFTPNKANRSRNGSTNKSNSPSRPTYEQGGAMLQLTWIEESFQAGLSEDGIIQSYFLTEKEKTLNREQKKIKIEEILRQMVRGQKNKDRKTLNMIERISEENYGLPLKLDTTWTKYTDLGYPFVVDTTLLVTKDKKEWTDFFKSFFKNDLINIPNQNQSETHNNNKNINNNNKIQNENITYYTKEEIQEMTEDERATEMVDKLQRSIRGRIIIHKEYMFPDNKPWIIDREGFTHHVYIGLDGKPNRILCNRKEMFQMLGDYYKRKDKQRIYIVRYSYKEYLLKLQRIEDHIQGGRQVERMDEDPYTRDINRGRQVSIRRNRQHNQGRQLLSKREEEWKKKKINHYNRRQYNRKGITRYKKWQSRFTNNNNKK